MRTHQVTGIGPTAADGSVELFTVLPKPFVVTAIWLAAQSRAPAMGDDLVEDAEGVLTLATTDAEQLALDAAAQSAADAKAVADAEAQKKTDGQASSSTGSAPSPLQNYVAKSFVVQAGKISVIENGIATLDNGESVEVASNVSVGDYWVEDGQTHGTMPASQFEQYFTAQ